MTKRDLEGIVMDVDHVRRLEQGAKILRQKRKDCNCFSLTVGYVIVSFYQIVLPRT